MSKLQKKLSALKEAIQHFKTWTFTNFFLLLWVIFALLDQDPDSESGSGSTDPIESGSNPDPDPQPWKYLSPVAYPGGMHRMHVHPPSPPCASPPWSCASPPSKAERLVMRKDEAVWTRKKCKFVYLRLDNFSPRIIIYKKNSPLISRMEQADSIYTVNKLNTYIILQWAHKV